MNCSQRTNSWTPPFLPFFLLVVFKTAKSKFVFFLFLFDANIYIPKSFVSPLHMGSASPPCRRQARPAGQRASPHNTSPRTVAVVGRGGEERKGARIAPRTVSRPPPCASQLLDCAVAPRPATAGVWALQVSHGQEHGGAARPHHAGKFLSDSGTGPISWGSAAGRRRPSDPCRRRAGLRGGSSGLGGRVRCQRCTPAAAGRAGTG
jgi:hypothetical protein